jgi:hypothetical protein
MRLRKITLRKMRFRKTTIVIGATVATLAVGSGVALAVWTVTGSGTGAGGAAVAQNLTVTAITPSGPAAALYPGGPPAQVYFTVANPNPFAVTITGISWGTPTSTNTTSCPNANISVDTSAPTTVSITVPANAAAGTAYQVNGVLDLAHSAPNGCQGVTFDVPLTLSAVQQ